MGRRHDTNGIRLEIAAPGRAQIAADANRGRDIALRECAPCHIVEPQQRREVALAPLADPFVSFVRQHVEARAALGTSRSVKALCKAARPINRRL